MGMTIGLVPHLEKPQALTACRELVEWLELHGIRPCCTREVGTRIKRPDLIVDEMGMAQARLLIKDLRALNEMVISKGAFSRMLELHMAIDGQRLDPLPADGVIVATPTGSTAYSLSAGGPIVAPDIGVLLLTPICPHSLHARPMVISPASTVQIRVQAQHEDILLTIDGQESCPLELGDQVVISRAKEVARFVKVSANGFFDVLRQKLGGPPSCYREGEL